jgi:predicted P-loop ATPase
MNTDTSPIRNSKDIQDHLKRTYGVTFSLSDIRATVRSIAKENSYNPIEEYVTGTAWDGVSRFNSLLTDVLGAPPSDLDSEYLRCFMVGAVARQLGADSKGFSNDLKVDTALILEGPRGVDRSVFFETLVGEHYTRANITPWTRRAYKIIHTSWVVEWADLERWLKSPKPFAVRSFVSVIHDFYPQTYPKTDIRMARRSVFVGTTNTGDYLSHNRLHNRRFLIILVPGEINTELLASMRDQLWAEAVHLYRSGKQWWLDAHFIALRGAP